MYLTVNRSPKLSLQNIFHHSVYMGQFNASSTYMLRQSTYVVKWAVVNHTTVQTQRLNSLEIFIRIYSKSIEITRLNVEANYQFM